MFYSMLRGKPERQLADAAFEGKDIDKEGLRVIRDGVRQKRGHNGIRGIAVDEVVPYEFCPADTTILQKMKHLTYKKETSYGRKAVPV